MAQFKCGECDHSVHFVEFKVNPEDDPDDAELECPECGSPSVYEE